MTIPPQLFDDQPESGASGTQTDDTSRFIESSEPSIDPHTTDEQLNTSDVHEALESHATERNVEDMTLAELIAQFFHTPRQILTAFVEVLSTPDSRLVSHISVVDVSTENISSQGIGKFVRRGFSSVFVGETPDTKLSSQEIQRDAIQLSLRLSAVVVGLYGSNILSVQRSEAFGLDAGIPYLLVAFLMWIAAEVYGLWPSLASWWQGRGFRGRSEDQNLTGVDDASAVIENSTTDASTGGLLWWVRLSLASVGLLTSILAGVLNINNKFTLPGVFAWIVSIGLWMAAFAPSHWNVWTFWETVKRIRIHRNWTFWTLLVIVLLGAYFRLNQLSTTPPEMTSDHVEKILDSQRILDGNPQVFFPNNGGRDPMQFYLLAFLKGTFGLPLDFLTLKLLTLLEGLVSIVLLWWMGREIIGVEDRKLGNLVGLILAALVAASYWHTSLSRLGLRIILTVSFTGLLIVFLARALRYNRRCDYIKAGLVLGFGLYAYQALRMLPVVVVFGVGMAIIFRGIKTRFGRRGDWQLRRYILHLAVLVIFSLVVFVPLLTFTLQYPNDFWRRTSGRLLGDDLIQTVNEEGTLIERVPTLDERLQAFTRNWPILADNIRNALLMYNWKGDVAWINAAPNRPAMDIFTGTLFILGLAAWLVRMIRRREVVDWLLPLILFIMLLPSALSIAYPVENPSATRTSGTLPEAYLFAALPLALICVQIMRLAPRRGILFAGGLSTLFVLGAYNSNQSVYFGEYSYYYAGSSLPYSDAGKLLEGFAESGGSFGNAFMIAYPYWWDHRAIGIEAGLLDWPNGIVTREDVPRFLYEASGRRDRYQLNPDKDLLFVYSVQDEQTEEQLKEWFPTGYSQIIDSYQPEDNFKVFRVPVLGNEGLIRFFVQTGAAG